LLRRVGGRVSGRKRQAMKQQIAERRLALD